MRSSPSSRAREPLQSANATVETARALGFTVGPLCGSLLVAAGGTAAAMLVDAASFVVVGAAGLALTARRYATREADGEPRRARDGIAFPPRGPGYVALMVLVVFVSLLFMSASIPADLVYVEDILGVRGHRHRDRLQRLDAGDADRLRTSSVAASPLERPRRGSDGRGDDPGARQVRRAASGSSSASWSATYFVGGVGHGLKNVASRTLIHVRVPRGPPWPGVRRLERHPQRGGARGARRRWGRWSVPSGARETLLLAGGLSALAGARRAGGAGDAPSAAPEPSRARVRSAPREHGRTRPPRPSTHVDVLPRGLLAEKLRRGMPLRVKLGIDPTAPDIHLGVRVVLGPPRGASSDAGHIVVLIVGDYTARIGDPSGRSKERPVLAGRVLDANARAFAEQAFRILDRERTEIRLQRRVARRACPTPTSSALTRTLTVAQLLERDDFAKRFAAHEPVSLSELLYPLMQAYDSVAIEADVEIGGTDQLYNLLAGAT